VRGGNGTIVWTMALLAACGGSYSAEDPACDQEAVGIVGLSGTLRRALQADGSFDDDPPEEIVFSREGRWNPGSGDLTYTEGYLDGYVIQERRFDGFGTVFGNGDLDLEGSLTTAFADEEEVLQQRMLQVACDVENTLRRGDDAVVWFENGTYVNKRYDFSLERLQAGVIAVGVGVVRATGAWELAESWRIGDVAHSWSRSSEGDGVEQAAFEVRGADRFNDGLVTVRPGGATAWDFEVTDGRTSATWEFALGPGGSGGGAVTYQPLLGDEIVCNVTVDGDSCDVGSNCDDAPRPNCWAVEIDGTDRSSPCCVP